MKYVQFFHMSTGYVPGSVPPVFDEAHKLSAHFFGAKLEKTSRFEFAEKLGAHTRHLLLMTATPHNGSDADFQSFLSLLDPERFVGPVGKPG